MTKRFWDMASRAQRSKYLEVQSSQNINYNFSEMIGYVFMCSEILEHERTRMQNTDS